MVALSSEAFFQNLRSKTLQTPMPRHSVGTPTIRRQAVFKRAQRRRGRCATPGLSTMTEKCANVPEPTMSKSDHRAVKTLHARLQERFPGLSEELRGDPPLKIGIPPI